MDVVGALDRRLAWIFLKLLALSLTHVIPANNTSSVIHVTTIQTAFGVHPIELVRKRVLEIVKCQDWNVPNIVPLFQLAVIAMLHLVVVGAEQVMVLTMVNVSTHLSKPATPSGLILVLQLL